MCRDGPGLIAGIAEGRHAALEARCGKWECEDCGPKKAARLRARAFAARCNRGFDLTIRHLPERTLEDETELLKQCWRDFRLWWNRTYPKKKIECLTVWELKGPRHVHLHVLARCGYVPQKVLRAFFWKRLRSPKQWIKTLANEKLRVAYATKYVTKALVKLQGTHRYSVTHGFEDAKDPPPGDPFFEGMDWTLQNTLLCLWVDVRKRWGWTVEHDAEKGVAKARPP